MTFKTTSSLEKSAAETEESVLNGSNGTKTAVKEILYDGYYYDVTEWVKRHPGGKVIEYFTNKGEDASIAIKQFHLRSADRVMAIMRSLKKRPANEVEISGNLTPTELKKHRAMTEDWMLLYKEFLEEGLFTPSKMHIFLRLSEIAVMMSVFFYWCTSTNPYIWYALYIWSSVGAVRTAYLVHESGHRSLTGISKVDRVIESWASGFINGMSSNYWNSQHNRHHAFPQRENHDIDLRTLPLIAFDKSVVKDKKTANSFWIRNQAYLFHFVDTILVGLAWKFYLHPKYALHKGLYLDLSFMFVHHIYLYILGLWSYLFCAWITAFILFGNFALNHTHTPVSPESKISHWAEYSFRHTININPSLLVDYWMGHLDFQIEHHLFPAIPHFRLWRIADRVKGFAAKHDLPYVSVPYFEAVRLTLANLNQVSHDVRKLHSD